MTLMDELDMHLKMSKQQIEKLQDLEQLAKPPIVQEIVLARRHAEDLHDRLKRAQNLIQEGAN